MIFINKSTDKLKNELIDFSYNSSVDKDKYNYFRYFAQKLFGKDFWIQVQGEQEQATYFLLAFCSLIRKICSLDEKKSLEIAHRSLLGERLSFNLEIDEFDYFYQKANKKFFKISLIPFLNKKLFGNFQAFNDLYRMYESKMFNEGELNKEKEIKFTYLDKDLLDM